MLPTFSFANNHSSNKFIVQCKYWFIPFYVKVTAPFATLEEAQEYIKLIGIEYKEGQKT